MEANKSKGIKYRGFNKSNLLNWLILLEKNGFVMCSFKNCNFMAFDIDGMADHYSRCNSDKSNIKFTCTYCLGGIDTEDNMLKHKVLHHPQHANFKEFSEFTQREATLFPNSSDRKDVSYVLLKSWQLFLDTKRYIKCLVQTCLYVANTVEQMALHYHHYCTPHMRDQLSYTCFSCHGRTANLSELKSHYEAAHPVGKVETNPVTQPILHHWSENLRKFNWAKCFNPKCNFIECDIATLKAHYSTCINPCKKDKVECSKCRGWLNGFAQLRKHINLAHNPYNPYPIVYMVPVKLINNTLLPTSESDLKHALSLDVNSESSEELFKVILSLTNIVISNRSPNSTPNKIISVQSVKDEILKSKELANNSLGLFETCDDLSSSLEKRSDSLFKPNDDDGRDEPESVTEGDRGKACSIGKMIKTKKSAMRLIASLKQGDAVEKFSIELDSDSEHNIHCDIESPSPSSEDELDKTEKVKDQESHDNDCTGEDSPSLKISEATRTYRHLASVKKKLPRIYPTYIPKSTNGIDCTKAQKAQVTFTKEAIDANKWKLDLPHVSIRNRNSSSASKKKPCNTKPVSTLGKIAEEISLKKGPLVPVSIRVEGTDKNWTIQVPNINLREDDENDITIQTKPGKKPEKTFANFKETYWDNIEAEMLELLNISVKNSSIRNPIRYHDHMTRNNPNPRTNKENGRGRLFEDYSTKSEELVDDPKEELGIASDRDSDSDDLFIDKPVDSRGDSQNTKLLAGRGKWCIKFVQRSNDEEDVDDPSSDEWLDPSPASPLESHLNSQHSISSDNHSEVSLPISKQEVPNEPTLSESNRSDLNIKKSVYSCKEPVPVCDSSDVSVLNLKNSLDNNTNSDSLNDVSNGIASTNDISCSTNIAVVKNNLNADNAESAGKCTDPSLKAVKSTGTKSVDAEGSGETLSLVSSCGQEAVGKNKPSSVCSDGIHCGTDDESVGSRDGGDHPDEGRLKIDDGDLNDSSMSDRPDKFDNSVAEESGASPENNIIPAESGASPDNDIIPAELVKIEQNDVASTEDDSRSASPPIHKGRKRKKGGASCTPKIKLACPSDEFDVPETADSSLEPVQTPSGSAKRRTRKPKKIEMSQLDDTSASGDNNITSSRLRRRRIPIGENVIVPDQGFVHDHPPVPAGMVDMDNDSSKALEVDEKYPRARRPKNKRSVDIMSALGNRITPTSPLAFPDKMVTCAVCSETMTAGVYQSRHLLKHNFLCWLLEEMPLPLEDFNTMVLVANRGKRAHPDFIFTCEKCERACKSSSGYLCHIRFCGKSKTEADNLMVACRLCNRLLKPNCVDQHMRQAHSTASRSERVLDVATPTRASAIKSKKKISEFVGILSSQDGADIPKTPASSDKGSKLNRVITKKLLSSWKEADSKGSPLFCPITNCDFRCHCYDTIQSHYRACNPLDPSQQIFSCKLCTYETNFKESYITHMRDDHCLIVHLPENSAHYPIHFLKELEDSIYCSFTWIRCATIFKPCLQLTKELREKCLCVSDIFPDLLVNWNHWSFLEDDNPYYQPDYHTSPAVRYNSMSEWLRLPCYSAASFKGESLLWTGGCVHSMAWCPIPSSDVSDQFLAVSCLLNFNQVFLLGTTYKQPTTLQLWNYGPVLNSENSELNIETTKTPMLSYALCVDEGPIWDIEWCSSGCFDPRRLGLLACAMASGSVNIYALPHPSQLEIPSERCPLFKGVPVLRLMFSRNEKYQCQKVSWSKVKPHSLIAGGYVNGFVALWDLSVSSTLLREGNVLYPCRLFQAHHSSVTCLSMCPVDNNYFLSGSTDKYIKLWDFRDVSNPIHTLARGGITDLDWLSHWIGFCYGMDAGLTPSPSSAFFASVRDFSFLTTPFIGHPTASVKSISANDWLNCVVTGYDDGNVILTSCLRQFGDGSDSKKKIAKFILRTDLVDLAREEPIKSGSKIGPEEDGLPSVPEDSSSYEDTVNMFGISISTSKAIEDKGKLDPVEEPRNDVFPIHSVTKVCFNPNQHSFLMVAVGFESGFVTGLQLVPSRQVLPDIQALSTQMLRSSENAHST